MVSRRVRALQNRAGKGSDCKRFCESWEESSARARDRAGGGGGGGGGGGS